MSFLIFGYLIIIETFNKVRNYLSIKIKYFQKFNLISAFLLLFLILGFRNYTVGIDTISYYDLYIMLSDLDWSTIFSSYYTNAVEFGYISLMKLSRYICNNYYFFQLIIAFWTLYNYYTFIQKFSCNKFLVLFLFITTGIYGASFNIARQIFACSIIAQSISFALKKRYLLSLLSFLFATTIHITSFICLIFFVLWKLKNNKNILLILSIIFLLGSFISSNLISLLTSNLFTKYEGYLDNDGRLLSLGFIRVIWFLEYLLLIWVIIKSNSSKTRFYAISASIYICFGIIGSYINWIDRLGLFFLPLLWLTLDRYILNLKLKRFKYSIYFIIYFVFGLMFFKGSQSLFQNYQSFL